METIDQTRSQQFTNPDTQAVGFSSDLLYTRCPSCNKLFAIDPLPAQMRQALYECTACQTQFAIEAEEVEPQEQAEAGLEAAQIASELALGAKPELIVLWKKVIDDYEDDFNHDSFIQSCVTAEALGYAAHKYARILSQFPGEEIARKMQKRIDTLVSGQIDAARAARAAARAPLPRSSSATRSSLIPSMMSLALVLGGLVTMIGFMAPKFHNMMGIGLSMIALILGIRFFANRPVS